MFTYHVVGLHGFQPYETEYSEGRGFLRKRAQPYNTITPNCYHKMYDNRSPDENSTQPFFVPGSTERCKIVCTNFLQVKIAITTVL